MLVLSKQQQNTGKYKKDGGGGGGEETWPLNNAAGNVGRTP